MWISRSTRYHLCCVIIFNTLVGCSSLQDQLNTTSRWKHLNTDLKSVLQNINKLATGETSLFLLIQEAAVYMNFAMNCARFFFFFYQDFLSQTLATHRTAGEGRGPSINPLYHFHPLTNIQTFICNFACEMTITYF